MSLATFTEATVTSAVDPFEARGSSALLFSAWPLITAVAQQLTARLGLQVEPVQTQLECLEALRRSEFVLVLVEESPALLDPVVAEAIYAAAGTAVVVEINFGVMRMDRVILAVRSALQRRKLDLERAAMVAQTALQQDLGAALTGLLLESQLAVRQAGPRSNPALDRLVDLAEHVCAVLRGDEPTDGNEEPLNLHHR